MMCISESEPHDGIQYFTSSGTARFEMPMDMIVVTDESGDLIALRVVRRCFEPVPEEVMDEDGGLVLGFLMTGDLNLMRSEIATDEITVTALWTRSQDLSERCAILPPLAGKRTGGAVCPCGEDTDRYGPFKPRSDAETEPDGGEFR